MQTALKEQHARYADIRKRLMGTPMRTVVAQKPRQEEIADIKTAKAPTEKALKQQHDNWKAVRARLFKPDAKPISEPVTEASTLTVARRIPMWKVAELHFDEHVHQYRKLVRDLMKEHCYRDECISGRQLNDAWQITFCHSSP